MKYFKNITKTGFIAMFFCYSVIACGATRDYLAEVEKINTENNNDLGKRSMVWAIKGMAKDERYKLLDFLENNIFKRNDFIRLDIADETGGYYRVIYYVKLEDKTLLFTNYFGDDNKISLDVVNKKKVDNIFDKMNSYSNKISSNADNIYVDDGATFLLSCRCTGEVKFWMMREPILDKEIRNWENYKNIFLKTKEFTEVVSEIISVAKEYFSFLNEEDTDSNDVSDEDINALDKLLSE